MPSFDDHGNLEYVIEMCLDVTDQRQSESDLALERERLSITLESVGDAVIATDTQGQITMVNRVAEQLTEWPAREATGMPLHDVLRILDETTRQPCEDLVSRVIGQGKAIDLGSYTLLIGRDGTERSIADSASPIRDRDDQIRGVVIVFRDVTGERETQQQLQHLSFHDGLTGLYNRSFFEEELRRLDSDRQLPLSIVMGDTNDLKLVNDAFGHQEGDRLLIKIAHIS